VAKFRPSSIINYTATTDIWPIVKYSIQYMHDHGINLNAIRFAAAAQMTLGYVHVLSGAETAARVYRFLSDHREAMIQGTVSDLDEDPEDCRRGKASNAADEIEAPEADDEDEDIEEEE
jgi:hypothetical protein